MIILYALAFWNAADSFCENVRMNDFFTFTVLLTPFAIYVFGKALKKVSPVTYGLLTGGR